MSNVRTVTVCTCWSEYGFRFFLRERRFRANVSAPVADNGAGVPLRDGYEIRRASVERRIPCLTSLDTARALVQALRSWRREHRSSVATLGEYVGAIAEVARA